MIRKLDERQKSQGVIDLKAWIPGEKKISGLLPALLIAALLLSCSPIARAGETEILILHTNNVTGHLFPCPT
jgi:hypothetical protein